MKVTDLRRKLMAALAAGGMLAPSAMYAANLNENLVVNGTFENVDINTAVQVAGSDPATYAVKILDWDAGTIEPTDGYAYSHDGQLDGMGRPIPDYANGGPLASGGHYYFTSNATPGSVEFFPDIHVANQMTQLIDVSTGTSNTLIAGGTAAFKISAYFSSYQGDQDFGSVYAEFLNMSGTPIGVAAQVNDNDTSTWSQNFGGGSIPIGTKTVRLSIFGTALAGGPDGYIDNVDFQVTDEIVQPVLELTVNRNSGSATLRNRTGSAENISGYQITSAFEALAPANWLSIAENYDSGNPGPNQVDAAHAWDEFTKANAHGDLSEGDLQSGDGANLSHTRIVNLGNLGAWIATPTEDLVFQYVSNGQVVQGIVNYEGNGGDPLAVGDLNASGSITSADWVIFRANQHANLTANSLAEAYRLGDLTGDKKNNHADFVLFKTAFENFNGAGSFIAMINAVPEPASILLVLAGGLFAMPTRQRSTNRKQHEKFETR